MLAQIVAHSVDYHYEGLVFLYSPCKALFFFCICHARWRGLSYLLSCFINPLLFERTGVNQVSTRGYAKNQLIPPKLNAFLPLPYFYPCHSLPHTGHLPIIPSSKESWDKSALDAAGVLGWSTKGANGHGSWLSPP